MAKQLSRCELFLDTRMRRQAMFRRLLLGRLFNLATNNATCRTFCSSYL